MIIIKKVIAALKKVLFYLCIGLVINVWIIGLIILGKLIAPIIGYGWHKIIVLVVNTFKCGPLVANLYILMGLILSACIGYVFVRCVENFEPEDNKNNGID